MTESNLDEIQPGWTVVAGDGEQLGTVLGTSGGTLRVRKGGLLGGELDVPGDAVEEVETGRVEIRLTRKELESR